MASKKSNKYNVTATTYKNLKKMGYSVDDKRSEGEGTVVIKQKNGVMIGAVFYENSEVIPNSPLIIELITLANSKS